VQRAANLPEREKLYVDSIAALYQIDDALRTELQSGDAERVKKARETIVGKKERELRTLESESYRQVQEIRGAADAEASRIYAEAYDQTPEAREFYGFLKTLETYRTVLGKQSKLMLSTDSDLFRLFKQSGK
jgi:membrane protease subunit HflC